MLVAERLEMILAALPRLRVGVLGDLFLDQYLEIEPAWTERSIETGLDAYQVAAVRNQPGAAGTVLNNLVALGVGHVAIVSCIGADGRGHEVRTALGRLGVNQDHLLESSGRVTPTYTKPVVRQAGGWRELNRLDIKNRTPLPADVERDLLATLPRFAAALDGLLVVDQVSEPDCGVVTGRVRDWLAEQGRQTPQRFILADSRERIGGFRNVCLKPNEAEALRGTGAATLAAGLEHLSAAAGPGRAVFCTRGAAGIVVAAADQPPATVPAVPVTGPIDVVGAGDSTAAAIACAVAAGATYVEAAAFGNLVASITIQQLGTTGTASPQQVRERFRAWSGGAPAAAR